MKIWFIFLFHIIFICLKNIFIVSTDESVMLHDKQKVICHTLIIAATILMLGSSSSYSFVFALPLQSAIHHHKVFDKKQDSGSNSKDARNGGDSSDNSDSSRASSTSDTKSSDS